MSTAITPEERAAWLTASEAAGLSDEDDRDALVAKSAALGIEAHWLIPRGKDISGQEHERYLAYVVADGTVGETLAADSVETALRLVVGEALTGRANGGATAE